MFETKDFQALRHYAAADVQQKSAVFIIPDAMGRYLLQLRDDFPHVVCPGQWGFFGGMIEPGESPVEGACRELEEELGLALGPTDLSAFRVALSERKTLWHIFETRTPPKTEALRLTEGAGMGWLTLAQIRKFDVHPLAREAILVHAGAV